MRQKSRARWIHTSIWCWRMRRNILNTHTLTHEIVVADFFSFWISPSLSPFLRYNGAILASLYYETIICLLFSFFSFVYASLDAESERHIGLGITNLFHHINCTHKSTCEVWCVLGGAVTNILIRVFNTLYCVCCAEISETCSQWMKYVMSERQRVQTTSSLNA